jgi:hypothetical protein
MTTPIQMTSTNAHDLRTDRPDLLRDAPPKYRFMSQHETYVRFMA